MILILLVEDVGHIMPRLREVARAKATENVRKYYDALFGDRDPVESPGTATGTPGNWWTVFALVPYVFDHATSHFGMFGMFAEKSISQLDGKVRELAIMRAGYTQSSQFVFSQHCKAARRFGITDAQIEAIPHWEVSDAFDARERAVLAWADALILQGGRASAAPRRPAPPASWLGVQRWPPSRRPGHPCPDGCGLAGDRVAPAPGARW